MVGLGMARFAFQTALPRSPAVRPARPRSIPAAAMEASARLVTGAQSADVVPIRR